MFEALARAAEKLSPAFQAAVRKPSAPGAATPAVQGNSGASLRRLAFVPLALGVASLVAGGVCFGVSKGIYGTLTGGPPGSVTNADALVSQGKLLQGLSAVLFTVGAAAAVAGGLMFVLGGSDDKSPSAGVVFTGNGAGLVGVFP
ncbi:MAG: hypothetical protein JNK82_08905 [Myxococcaceae bacterium]|nr:hypothetical protein [Myxococcaceae bacterium]